MADKKDIYPFKDFTFMINPKTDEEREIFNREQKIANKVMGQLGIERVYYSLNNLTADELIDHINGRNDIKVYGDIQKVEQIKKTMAQDDFTQEAINYFLQMDLSFLNNKTWADMLENSDFRAITGCKMYNRED